jgi:hypothetical protein
VAGRQGIFRNRSLLFATVRRISPTLSDCTAWLVSVFAAIGDGLPVFATFAEAMSLAMSLVSKDCGDLLVNEPAANAFVEAFNGRLGNECLKVAV